MCSCWTQAARKAHAELKAARKSLAPPPRLTSSGLALLKASQQVLPGSWRAMRSMCMHGMLSKEVFAGIADPKGSDVDNTHNAMHDAMHIFSAYRCSSLLRHY
jgi:predicted nuclease with RNAse H fold